jgi:hypothetical protein
VKYSQNLKEFFFVRVLCIKFLYYLLGSFTKLRETNIGYFKPVCLRRINRLQLFGHFWFLRFFRTSVQEIQVELKIHKITVLLIKTSVYYNVSLNVLEGFQTRLYRSSKYTLRFNFFSENSAVYENMWKNMVQTERTQMTT